MDADFKILSVAAVWRGVRTRRHSKRNVWRTSSFRSEENSKTSKSENHQNQLDFIVYFEKWTKKKNFGLTRTIRDTHGFCDATILYILSTVIDLERLYESCGISSCGGEALSRAEPPAGPLKFDLSFGDVTFSEISLISRCHARTYAPVQLFQKRINRHGTYISG